MILPKLFSLSFIFLPSNVLGISPPELKREFDVITNDLTALNFLVKDPSFPTNHSLSEFISQISTIEQNFLHLVNDTKETPPIPNCTTTTNDDSSSTIDVFSAFQRTFTTGFNPSFDTVRSVAPKFDSDPDFARYKCGINFRLERFRGEVDQSRDVFRMLFQSIPNPRDVDTIVDGTVMKIDGCAQVYQCA
ncbi:hypothetical protein L218DRAFT_968109 [Marasmius fiardii PR-910]|nr:hypothetical protein L218DRAFT_968109 [Marasmius fiardii PR-910]